MNKRGKLQRDIKHGIFHADPSVIEFLFYSLH